LLIQSDHFLVAFSDTNCLGERWWWAGVWEKGRSVLVDNQKCPRLSGLSSPHMEKNQNITKTWEVRKRTCSTQAFEGHRKD
jgi:hypothetical protein